MSIFLISFYLFFSHAYPLKELNKETRDLESFIIPNHPVFKFDGYSFYQTIYSANKIAAAQAFISHPWSGVGPRNYIPFVQNLMAEGKYKGTDRFLNPHCTYTSVAARFGLIGICGMIIFLFGVRRNVLTISDLNLKALFSIVYITFGLEAVTSDLEYARIFWFFNAWLTAHLFYQSSLAGDHKEQSTQ